MSGTTDVVWTRRALRNLEDIAAYIAEDNPDAAERVVRRIAEQSDGLAYYPRIGRLGNVAGTRELPIANSPYIVVYRITDRVEVLRIRHASQRWP
jgi:addiction module RelE/StbE family toxin